MCSSCAAIEFAPLTIEFVVLAVEFLTLAIEFITLAGNKLINLKDRVVLPSVLPALVIF